MRKAIRGCFGKINSMAVQNLKMGAACRSFLTSSAKLLLARYKVDTWSGKILMLLSMYTFETYK